MTQIRKIFAWAVIILAFLPALLIFNNNGEAQYLGCAGLAWASVIVRFRHKIFPKWVIDIISSDDDAED